MPRVDAQTPAEHLGPLPHGSQEVCNLVPVFIEAHIVVDKEGTYRVGVARIEVHPAREEFGLAHGPKPASQDPVHVRQVSGANPICCHAQLKSPEQLSPPLMFHGTASLVLNRYGTPMALRKTSISWASV
jgi:hypothetical protein